MCKCSRYFNQTINSRISKKTAMKIVTMEGDMMYALRAAHNLVVNDAFSN
jgi:hypothetical protein